MTPAERAYQALLREALQALRWHDDPQARGTPPASPPTTPPSTSGWKPRPPCSPTSAPSLATGSPPNGSGWTRPVGCGSERWRRRCEQPPSRPAGAPATRAARPLQRPRAHGSGGPRRLLRALVHESPHGEAYRQALAQFARAGGLETPILDFSTTSQKWHESLGIEGIGAEMRANRWITPAPAASDKEADYRARLAPDELEAYLAARDRGAFAGECDARARLEALLGRRG